LRGRKISGKTPAWEAGNQNLRLSFEELEDTPLLSFAQPKKNPAEAGKKLTSKNSTLMLIDHAFFLDPNFYIGEFPEFVLDHFADLNAIRHMLLHPFPLEPF